MKIAVDARELVGKPTGVGRYLSKLVECWSASSDATRHEWRFYVHDATALNGVFASATEVLPGSGGTRWEQWTLPRALSTTRPDVLFAPGYSAPFTTPCPIALTVHDVSFFARPAWFSPREGLRRRRVTAWSARRAAVVLTDSAFSRDEIVRHIGIPSTKIRVVAPGLPASPLQADQRARGPHILFVGSLFRRRHVDRLIAAFTDSIARRVPESSLQIVGEDRSYPPIDYQGMVAGSDADIRQRITLASYVDESELSRLYSAAAVFVFPSEYEGFGFTPLEALQYHVPPIVLDTPIAREVYGPAARYVNDVSHPLELADAIVELLTNTTARDAVLRHADEVLARYDWNRAATATLRAIEEAAGA